MDVQRMEEERWHPRSGRDSAKGDCGCCGQKDGKLGQGTPIIMGKEWFVSLICLEPLKECPNSVTSLKSLAGSQLRS